MAAPRIFYPDTPELPLPQTHRFPASKYRLLRETIVNQRIFARTDLSPSPPVGRRDLLRAHEGSYIDAVLEGKLSREAQRRIGLPWSATLVRRSRAAVGGSLAAGREALEFGISGQLAGGTHHAHAGFGSGYCVFNDLAVASLALLDSGAAARIAILDLDVHQGDGNSSILVPNAAVHVVSVHGEKNFPFRKVASDLDIGLPDGTADGAYLRAVDQALSGVMMFAPDLVFYLAGVDPLADDSLGRFSVTPAGLAQRDEMVLERCRTRGVPVAIVAGGGYAKPIAPTVEAYAETWRTAARLFDL